MKIDREHDALIIVDLQNDFCPGGALAVPEGDKVVPLISNALKHDWITVATRDWHPQNHSSFKEQGGIWPVHCIAETKGAAFHPDLNLSRVKFIISKAETPQEEAYSGFQGTTLSQLLRQQGVKRVFVCGLATDYCVKATALDAKKEGFEVVVLEDAIRGVEVQKGDVEKAIAEMKTEGVTFIRSTDLEP